MSSYEQPAKSILHPTDFSPTSESAFAHALAIAVNNKAKLSILHVMRDRNDDVPWHDYPGVRDTLERWGYLEPGSHQRDVNKELGIKISKAVGVGKNVVNSIVGFTDAHDFDLIVMATNENQAMPFWSKQSVAVPVSQKTKLPTLFVPQAVPGCVSLGDGSVSLDHVLIPVGHQPDVQPALERIVWVMNKVGGSGAIVSLLHVGNTDRFPLISPPEDNRFTWSKVSRAGDDVSAEIVKAAKALNARLIVMVTEGKKDLLDAIRGDTVQQVLRKAPCPVFTIPSA